MATPPIHIPDLSAKLTRLYGLRRNPAITSHESLGAVLDRSKATISNWITGSGGSQPESVPAKAIDDLCRAFYLTQETFCAPMAAFNRALDADGWDTLLRLARPAEEAMLRVARVAEPTRCFEEPPEEDPDFRIGEQFRVVVRGPSDWRVILLLEGGSGVKCMRPSAKDADNALIDGQFCAPRESHKPFRFTQPGGKHQLVALLQAQPWDATLYQELMSGESARVNAAVSALALHAQDADSQVLRHEFVVG